MSEWQPIETAPKDGTRIIAFSKRGDTEIIQWCEGCWVDDHFELLEYGFTHWMPIPEPPK